VSREKGKEVREISDRSLEGKWLVLFYSRRGADRVRRPRGGGGLES
jgi:hypothetical protein